MAVNPSRRWFFPLQSGMLGMVPVVQASPRLHACLGCPRRGRHGGVPGGAGGGRAAPTQPQRPRALEAAPCQSRRNLPRRRGCQRRLHARRPPAGTCAGALGRTGFATLPGAPRTAVASLDLALGLRASRTHPSYPMRRWGWLGTTILGIKPQQVPKRARKCRGKHPHGTAVTCPVASRAWGWWHRVAQSPVNGYIAPERGRGKLSPRPPAAEHGPDPSPWPAGMLAPGPLATEEERNFFKHHPRPIQTPHRAGARLSHGIPE